jgi:hypothetical protein
MKQLLSALALTVALTSSALAQDMMEKEYAAVGTVTSVTEDSFFVQTDKGPIELGRDPDLEGARALKKGATIKVKYIVLRMATAVSPAPPATKK